MSEDDCRDEKKMHNQKITLKLEPGPSFELSPWIDSTDFPANNPFRSHHLQTVQATAQTQPNHGPLIDKYIQTTTIEMKVKKVFLCASKRIPLSLRKISRIKMIKLTSKESTFKLCSLRIVLPIEFYSAFRPLFMLKRFVKFKKISNCF